MPEDPRAIIAAKLDQAKAQAPAPAPLEILSFDDMLEPDLVNRWLVKALIPYKAVVMLYGESGCGKTFVTLDLALHIAAGLNWCGLKTAAGRVVYVAAEAGRSIRNRVAAWASEHEYERVDLRAVVSPVDLCHLNDQRGDADRLIAAIGEADVVIIDTVSRALAGGNENGPDDMGAFVATLDKMRATLGCTLIAVHHVGKDASRGGRGHSLLHCAVDTEIEVAERDDIRVATVTKQRDGPGGTEFGFRLRAVTLGEDQDGDPVTTCVVEPEGYVPPKKEKLSGQKKAAYDTLIEVVKQSGEMLDHGLWGVKVDSWRSALKAAGFGKPYFDQAWGRAKELEEKNHILFDKEQTYVWPTNKKVQKEIDTPEERAAARARMNGSEELPLLTRKVTG